jgi:tRNA threonylcarbamoyladenosine biosynthesis protein TsaB
MLLLAIDTSGKHGSIALAQCGPDQACVILEGVPLAGGTFSAQLVPQVAALLATHGFSKSDLGGFAVASGPGSFTGLRVGLAAIKALAEVLGGPISAVSLLDAVSAAAESKGKVMAALDAGRNEIFVGRNEPANEMPANKTKEQLLTREEFLNAAREFIVATPDAGIAQLAKHAGLAVEEIERPGSDAIAQLGWKKILAGETVSARELEANYIRRSDAEIFARPL